MRTQQAMLWLGTHVAFAWWYWIIVIPSIAFVTFAGTALVVQLPPRTMLLEGVALISFVMILSTAGWLKVFRPLRDLIKEMR